MLHLRLLLTLGESGGEDVVQLELGALAGGVQRIQSVPAVGGSKLRTRAQVLRVR